MQSAVTATGSGNGPQTLGNLFTRAEHSATSSSSRTVLRTRGPGGWVDLPSWRFFRQIVRMGLYLAERSRVQAGDRVLFFAGMRPETIVGEWATLAQGGVVATLEPRSSDEKIAKALRFLEPRVVFAEGDAARERLLRASKSSLEVITIGGTSPAEGAHVPWAGAMELGGTLDTAERATAFRAAARALRAEAAAIAHTATSDAGEGEWTIASHTAVVDRLVDLWANAPLRPDSVAYVVDARASTGMPAALWAFLAGGRTTLVLGSPEREVEEVAELRPNFVIGPREALARVAANSHAEPASPLPWIDWLRRARAGGSPSLTRAASQRPQFITPEGSRFRP